MKTLLTLFLFLNTTSNTTTSVDATKTPAIRPICHPIIKTSAKKIIAFIGA